MRLSILIFFLVALVSCSEKPVFNIPSNTVVISSDFCKYDGAYRVKKLKLKSFHGINIDEFHKCLDCKGFPNDMVSVLKPTRIKDLQPGELSDLDFFLKMKVECDTESHFPIANDDIVVSGCRIKFKNSTNGIIYTYNNVFFIDKKGFTIYEISTL